MKQCQLEVVEEDMKVLQQVEEMDMMPPSLPALPHTWYVHTLIHTKP